MTPTSHQLNQLKVIEEIAQQIEHNSLNFTTVPPVADYEHDHRLSLTSVHLPDQSLMNQVQQIIIEPLQKIEPNFYYYPNDNLHMTIKNIKVISDPPLFNDADVDKAIKIFSETIPRHHKYQVYFYRLLLFPNNLSLIGTTDEELDKIVLDLDQKLTAHGIPDDKIYTNSRYFFCNMSLARFSTPPSAEFKQKVGEISASLKLSPYQVDSVSLVVCNAVLSTKQIRGSWKLQ